MSADVRVGRFRLSRPAAGAALAALAFIALSAWWLAIDKRTPGGGDPADHLMTALRIGDLLRSGDLGGIFDVGYDPNTDRFYPPLVQLVGGIAPALHLTPIQDWGELAVNLVFVPMLAAGTYLVGRRVYGPTAGLLAAIFALGTPMVLSLFHVFLLDAPLAATVAIALAALIASERFSDRRASVLAGALIGLAMLVKTIAPLYLAGPVLVMLLGGGWRQWRNLALAAAALLVVAGPYYVAHLDQVLNVGEEATVGTDLGATGTAFERESRIGFDNLTWYGWAAINEQYFVPLLLLFVVGLVAALREIRTRPGVLELLVGIAVTYLALPVALSLRDPRYSLPLVVFVAVIATGWIATTPRTVFRRIGLAVLGVAVAANVAVSITGKIPVLRLEAPGTNFEFGIDPGSFTILDDTGYWVGPPETNPLWPDLFAAAERNGLDTMRLYTRQQPLFWGVDYKGLDVFGVPYGVREVTVNAPRPWPPADLHVTIWTDDAEFVGRRGFAEPCAHIEEGASLLNGEPVNTSVLVERRTAGGYERWCEF